jgi:2'-5' RNA ligase
MRMQMGAMGHAVELLFDPTTEAAIKGVWARLETAGVPSLASWTHRRHRPHISLSVAGRIDTGQLQGVRDCLAATHLDVTLYSPAVFPRPSVLYLSVVPTMTLLRLHEEVHAALGDSMVAPRDGYSVGTWVPHCTLAHDLTRAQLARGIDLLHDQPPVTAHISSAGLLDTTTGEVLPIATLRSHQ